MRLAVLTPAALFSIFLLHSAEAAPHRGQDASPGILSALLLGESSSRIGALRHLARRDDPRAPKQLLALVEESKQFTEGERLELVRALHAHRNSVAHRSIERALLQLLGPITRARGNGPEGAALGRMVRASAALSLASTGRTRGLRALIALAIEPEGHDEEGRALALDALTRFPISDPTLSKLFQDSLPAEAEEQGQPAGSPSRLVRLLEALTWGADVQGLLEQHVQATSLDSSFSSMKEWAKALDESPTWGLRALTIFSATRLPGLKSLLLNQALKHLDHKNTSTRSAANWALAVSSPKKSGKQLSSKDPVIISAVLRQAHLGTLALDARKYAARHSKIPLGRLARRLSLLAAPTWSKFSTRALWNISKNQSSAQSHISPLAARLTNRDPRLSVTTIESWLGSSEPSIRSAAVRGLAHNSEGVARALLMKAYRLEPDARVRRVIARALSNSGPPVDEAAQLIAVLDPDAACRDLVRGLPATGVGFRVEFDESTSFEWTDRMGRVLAGVSAPDGFRGVVSRDL